MTRKPRLYESKKANARLQFCGAKCANVCMSDPWRSNVWVAVKELKVSDQNHATLLSTIYPYDANFFDIP